MRTVPLASQFCSRPPTARLIPFRLLLMPRRRLACWRVSPVQEPSIRKFAMFSKYFMQG